MMKVVILAGGFGTRISEESQIRPKPLVEVGNRPIIWHIMKIYSHYGFNDFVICCGYKGELLKQYFRDFMLTTGDVVFDMGRNTIEIQPREIEPWRITLVDTGLSTMTGGRLRRVRHLLDDTFMMTYGDGVGDVDIKALVEFHRRGGKQATVTAVSQPGRFGALHLEAGDPTVHGFREKGKEDGGLINGGFFVLEPGVIDLIDDDETVWELEPLERLVAMNQLQAFRHHGFWQPMDTLRDKHVLEDLWNKDKAPWKVWDRPAAAADTPKRLRAVAG